MNVKFEARRPMEILDWRKLDPAQQEQALARAPANRSRETTEAVADIIASVRDSGDAAVRELTRRFDQIDSESAAVTTGQREQAASELAEPVRLAIDLAFANLRKFHDAAKPDDLLVETVPGVVCQARYQGIDRVGLYAPGGRTPLPSSVLMMGVPAMIAGCRKVVLCCGPAPSGQLDPAIAYAAQLCEIHAVFQVGGAQAIAAMAFGTESVPACDKLFGPGSVWVTEAKRQVANSEIPVTIDMAAGPSEVMVVADALANPTFVAADLLAQMEHGADSQAILVTDSREMANRVVVEVERLASLLSREKLIRKSLLYSRVIIASDIDTAMEIANRYAAEHLIIQTEDAEALLPRVNSAGSVFLGPWTPEVLGDYCSGTNHVLPTCGLARSVNGLTTTDFMKRITVQTASREGLLSLAEAATTLANWEGLTAHAMAVTVRQQAQDKPERIS